jgi:hypothetical protein
LKAKKKKIGNHITITASQNIAWLPSLTSSAQKSSGLSQTKRNERLTNLYVTQRLA